MSDVLCEQCGDKYKRIGAHWSKSPECSHPPLSESQHELIRGILISQGSIETNSRYPAFRVSSGNKALLDWIADELGVFASSVSLQKTAEEVREAFEARGMSYNNPKPEYRLTMLSHPDLESYSVNWYTMNDEGTREKHLPVNLPWSPMTLRVWYAFAGYLETSNQASDAVFSVTQQKDDLDVLLRLCDRYTPRVYTDESGELGPSVYLHLRNAEALFDDIGEAPVSSVAEKWPDEETTLRSDTDAGDLCPTCGRPFSNLNSHWRGENGCSYPTPSQKQKDILYSLVLSGSYVNKTGETKLPHLLLDSTNRDFLDYLNRKLGIFTSHISKRASAETSRKRLKTQFNTEPEETRAVYRFQTRGHPYLDTLYRWANRRGNPSESIEPPIVRRSPDVLKTMYLHRGSKVGYTESPEPLAVIRLKRITASEDTLLDLFEPFDARIRNMSSEFRVLEIGDTDAFFEYIGEPPAFAAERWM